MTSSLFRRFSRLLPVLLCLGAPVVPAAAQPPEPARFLLESIVVEGVQRDAPREIVVGESLLKPGNEYTEQELREAVYRIKRLPFVVDAAFSLRKGSERGAYELVITVKETSVFFYSVSAGGLYNGNNGLFQDEDHVTWGAAGTAGARWFVGSQGVVFGSVQAFDEHGVESAQVGYTRYNLFGRGGFATVGLSTNVDDDAGDGYQGSLSLGIPIAGNHSIRVDLSTQQLDFGRFAGASFERESYSASVAWIYDTTDDPLFPSTGSRVTGSVGYDTFRDEIDDVLFGRAISRADYYRSALTGRRHWSLTPRQSIGAELGGSIDRLDDDDDFLYSGVTQYTFSTGLLHSMDLWGFEKTERIGDFRWENAVRLGYADDDVDFIYRNNSDLQLETSLVFRNTLGVMRLSFGYVEALDGDGR